VPQYGFWVFCQNTGEEVESDSFGRGHDDFEDQDEKRAVEPSSRQPKIVPDLTFDVAGSRVFLDVSCANPCARSVVKYAGASALAAAGHRELDKLRKYDGLIRSTGAMCVPFVVESFGAFCKKASEYRNDCSVRRVVVSHGWFLRFRFQEDNIP
jgi:hypothetical protein